MFKKLANNIKLAKEIRNIPFWAFGIKANNNFDIAEISKHIKAFRDSSELEIELNKLMRYIYGEKRTIHFHEFRQFPYICHGKENSIDMSGLAQNYTNSDIYLIKFMVYEKGKYLFFDVDFIIQNTKRIGLNECSINNMPIDEIIR